MPTCSKCHEDKVVEEFSRNKAKKSGYNNVCDACKKQYQSDWYYRHQAEQQKRVCDNKNAIREYVKHVKESTPCKDCGKNFPYYVMDFDHTEKDKKFNLAHCKQYGFNKVKAEIEKCEVVCSNCHRIRTHERK